MARILIVDDENNIRMMVRLALQHVGHTVETAADGTEGLQKFGNGSNFDLVLLDQRMPGLEGLDVLKQMRYQHPTAKIIMATAFGTIDLAVDAMKSGATDFLRKPFTAETLRGAVQSALKDNAFQRPTPQHPTPDSPFRRNVRLHDNQRLSYRVQGRVGPAHRRRVPAGVHGAQSGRRKRGLHGGLARVCDGTGEGACRLRTDAGQ